jgi:hypothetical protein
VRIGSLSRALLTLGTALCLLPLAGSVRAQDTEADAPSTATDCVPACSRAGDECEDGKCISPPIPLPEQPATPDDRNPFGNLQIALRAGVQVPFGQVTGNGPDAMSESFSWQGPLVLEIGWKFFPNLFVGLYGSLGFGGTSGAALSACSENNLSCFAFTGRAGLEAQYHFAPAAPTNPWLGYGIGYESSTIYESNDNGSDSVTASGWEFGHFMAGVDFLLSKKIAIGPLVDFSLGQYTSLITSPIASSTGGGIAHSALHEWLFIGGRIVVFP